MIDLPQSYPDYRDAGAPWLGRVPAHWLVKRCRYLFREVDQRSATGQETHLSMSQKLGLVPSEEVEQRTLVSESYAGAKLCREGDLVLNRLKAHLGVFARATRPGVISPDYTVLRPRVPLHIRFFEETLRSPVCRRELRIRAKGIVEGFWRLYTDDFYDIRLPVPPLDEQAAIVRFLDHADRRIRKYIAAKQKLIKLLEEQKRAIVHRAITHGLDPAVRMKPAGIDWLGDVPWHWQVLRLKALVSRVTSGSRGWSNYASDSGVLFLRIGNLTRASINLDLDDVVRLALPASVMGEAARTRVQAGDILVSITAYIGSVAVVPDGLEEAYVSQHVACCRPRGTGADPRWIAYVLLSNVGQTHGQLSMYGGTKQGLSLDDVRNYVVLVPPLAEQQRVVEWIEVSCKKIDIAVTAAKREIDLLRQFRARLVADVVTGQLDVRAAATELPDLIDAEPIEDGGENARDLEAMSDGGAEDDAA